MDDDPAPELPRSGPKVGLVIFFVVIVALLALFLWLRAASTSEVRGALALDAGELAPDRCRSGNLGEDAARDRARFHGVELFAAARPERSVRVLEDPVEGPLVLVNEPGAAPARVDRSACARYDVTLRSTDQLIMDVWGMEGSVDLDCPGARGRVTFEACYGGR